MLTLMDKAPEDKHRALVAALAHLLQLCKPSLGRSGALHQAAQAYHACLTETGGGRAWQLHTCRSHHSATFIVCATPHPEGSVQYLVLALGADRVGR